MEKSELRRKAKIIRKTLDIEGISKNICEKIRHSETYKQAQNVMIFYPMKYEINLLELLEDKKNFYLPKVYNSGQLKMESGKLNNFQLSTFNFQPDKNCFLENKKILVCPYSSNLKKSDLNIYEPCTEPVNPEILDLIFVPALMVDGKNYRLGYGGGFYDRFLAKYPNIKTIVPIAKELITEKLPHESFDIKVDEIII